MKKLYLHIGASKTGTTSVQSYLFKNREWLKEGGVLVPQSESDDHHPLAKSIINRFMRDPVYSTDREPIHANHDTLWEQFREEVDNSNCPVIILSSEVFRRLYRPRFSSQSNAMICWLDKQLAGLDVQIVCYLRPLDSQLKSQYKQNVRTGHKTKAHLSDYISKQIAEKEIHAAPTAFLNLFAEQFGADHLILRRYERDTLVNGDIVDDFLNLVGLPLQYREPSTKGKNPSLPDELVDMQRIFNELSGAPIREARRIGLAFRQATMPFDITPADDGQSIRETLQTEHDKLAENYNLDLGEVGELFVKTQTSSVEARGQTVLISMLYKEVRELRTRQGQPAPSKELKELHARLDKLEKLIHTRTSIRKRFKSFFRKLFWRFRTGSTTKSGYTSR